VPSSVIGRFVRRITLRVLILPPGARAAICRRCSSARPASTSPLGAGRSIGKRGVVLCGRNSTLPMPACLCDGRAGPECALPAHGGNLQGSPLREGGAKGGFRAVGPRKGTFRARGSRKGRRGALRRFIAAECGRRRCLPARNEPGGSPARSLGRRSEPCCYTRPGGGKSFRLSVMEDTAAGQVQLHSGRRRRRRLTRAAVVCPLSLPLLWESLGESGYLARALCARPRITARIAGCHSKNCRVSQQELPISRPANRPSRPSTGRGAAQECARRRASPPNRLRYNGPGAQTRRVRGAGFR